MAVYLKATFWLALLSFNCWAQTGLRDPAFLSSIQARQAVVSGNSTTVRFDGVDDLVLGASIPFASGSGEAMSISCWVRASATSSSVRCIWRPLAASIPDFGLYHWSDNKFTLYAGGAATQSGAVVANQWYHIVITQADAAGAPKIYMDGSELAAGSPVRRSAATADIYVGADEFGQAFAGDITDLACWNLELSAGNVTTLHNAGRGSIGGLTSGLIAYWKMNDKAVGESYDGFTFPDASGNGKSASGSDGANNTGLNAANQ